MAVQLQDVITAARDRHPAFFKTRVPNATIARFLSDYQNELIGKAVARDKQFLAQKASIVINLDASSAPGTVGAGVGAGLPGTIDDSGAFSLSQSTAGGLVDVVTDPERGAQVLISEHVVASATATSLTDAAAGWTVNAYSGRLAVITDGPGKDERRLIISNTVDTLVISTGTDGLQWTALPTPASIFSIVAPAYEGSDDVGVVTALPATLTQTGYLVKLSASGVPVIDYTKPLIATVEAGVPLPSALAILGGTVHFSDGDRGELALVPQGERFRPERMPAAYTVGQTLFCCGCNADWCDVASLELDYVPIAPAFTQLIDYVLLPDAARPALVAAAAAFMAQRCAGMPDVQIDPRTLTSLAAQSEAAYLSTIRLTRRARRIRFRCDGY